VVQAKKCYQKITMSFTSSAELQPATLVDTEAAFTRQLPSIERRFNFGEVATRSLVQDGVEQLSIPEDAYSIEHDAETYEVHVKSYVTLADYERITPPEDMERLKEYAETMQGKELLFVNATASGGGVAIMRSPLVHLYSLLGVKARWFALKPGESDEKQFFDVTKKKFHNVLQDVSGPEVRLNDEDKAIYCRVIDANAEVLREPLRTADVIVIDDWQPAGLIPHLKGYEETRVDGSMVYHLGINPTAKILFRDHIQTEGQLMSTPGTPQHTTWDYIWRQNRVNEADVFVTHPMDEFVPPDVPENKVIFMPATGDLLDDLNRQLTDFEKRQGLDFINDQLASNQGQEPLDLSRPYIVLIARFDPSKGMPQGMESFVKAREKMKAKGVRAEDMPQLVVLGNGSIDDPDGLPELQRMMDIRAGYGDIKDDIKIARVPHNDRAINALLKGAQLALQPSTKEGFESRVTDAILQGVPVIGSNRGGIPLQIVEGESGHVIDPYDTDRWADHIAELLTDTDRYGALRKRTAELAVTNNYRFTTVPNALRWLGLSIETLHNPNFQGNRRWVEDLVA
jgi:alpha,alpha-trehalose phosphorylase (configuration-retaining)